MYCIYTYLTDFAISPFNLPFRVFIGYTFGINSYSTCNVIAVIGYLVSHIIFWVSSSFTVIKRLSIYAIFSTSLHRVDMSQL